MVRFQHPEALYLLFLLIPLGGMFAWFLVGRGKAIKRIGHQGLVSRLMPEKPKSKHTLKFVLIVLSVLALVFALANPQMGRKTETVQREGVDLFIAMDISQSMLAEDVKPDRLSSTKQFLGQLIDRLGGDRVGLIVFAGNPYLQVPMTTDYAAVRTILRTVNTNLAGTQGTDIGSAIEMAEQAFARAESKHKVVLLVSDGEDHQEEALAAAKEAADQGTTLITVGVGSPQGSPVPDLIQGRRVGFKKDAQGSIILSKLNEGMLQEVAAAGRGSYFRIGGGRLPVNEVRTALSALEKQQYEEEQFTDFEDQYQWLLAIALLLLVIEFFISERRTRLLSRIGYLNRQGGN